MKLEKEHYSLRGIWGGRGSCGKDTGLLDDDISGCMVKHHLVEDIDDLRNKLIIFLLS